MWRIRFLSSFFIFFTHSPNCSAAAAAPAAARGSMRLRYLHARSAPTICNGDSGSEINNASIGGIQLQAETPKLITSPKKQSFSLKSQ